MMQPIQVYRYDNINQLCQPMRKNQKQQKNDSGDSVIIKSCDHKFGEDPIESSSQEFQPIPRPKSYKSDEDNNWEDLTSTQKLIRKQEMAKALGVQQRPKKNKNIINENKRNNRQFTDEILDSQEVSVLDSSQQAFHHNSQNGALKEQSQKNKPYLHKQYFNLMLLGAASTGKTTYMECFLKQYKRKHNQKTIKQHTQTINQVKSPSLSSHLNLQFYIIDTPGYTHSSIDKYSNMIQQQIKNRIENYKRLVKNSMTMSSVYEKEERQIRDERIHCCLFFFRGPRLHSDDWALLEKLHDSCNIIPVIAKGDCYTIQQIMELKKNILNMAKQKQNYWFNIEEYIRQKYPEQLPTLNKGPYGASPPFMLACSTSQIQKNNDIMVGRQFRWGTCIVEDEKHTEFSVLNRLLIKYLREGFVKMTNVKQDVERTRIQQKSMFNVNKVRQFLMIGLPMCLAVGIAMRWGKHNQLK